MYVLDLFTIDSFPHLTIINFIIQFSSNLRSFQYKLLHRAKYLFQCKIKDSDLCYFCHETTESLEYVFWFCSKVKKFLDEVNYCQLPENFMIPKFMFMLRLC